MLTTAVEFLPTPEKEGYTFKGYYNSGNLIVDENGRIQSLSGTVLQNLLSNPTLTAHWEISTVAVTSVTLNSSNESIKVGESKTLTATVLPAEATNKNVTWSSSDTSIATVSNTGVVTGIKKGGPITITVTTADGSKTATCAITVVENSIPLQDIDIFSTQSGVVGNIVQLVPVFTPSNATNKNVTWSSSNKSVATVDSSGNINCLAPGKTTITVTSQENATIKDTCEFTVTQNTVAVTGIEIVETSPQEVNVGKTITLTATIKPTEATNKNVTWSSSDNSIATVNNSGVVTGVKEGEVLITATSVDGGHTATCKVIVKDGVVKPAIKKIEGKMAKGVYTVYITLEDNGAEIAKVEVDGEDITKNKTSDGRYYFVPKENKKYTVTVTNTQGNKVTEDYTVSSLLEKAKAEASKDNNGKDIVLITPQTNKEVEKVTVDGKDITENKTEDGKYWFIPSKNGDYEIEITYKDEETPEKLIYTEKRFTEEKPNNNPGNTPGNTPGNNPGSTPGNTPGNGSANNSGSNSSNKNNKGSTYTTSGKTSDSLVDKVIPKTGYQVGLLIGIITLAGVSIVFYKKSKM